MQAWVQLEDARTARPYFANRLTNEVSWLDPKTATVPQEQLQEAGWAEAEDTAGGRYYYNLKTKVVSWTWPPSNVEGGMVSQSSFGGGSNNSGGGGGHDRRRRGTTMVMGTSLSKHPLGVMEGGAGIGISIEAPSGGAVAGAANSNSNSNTAGANHAGAGGIHAQPQRGPQSTGSTADGPDYDADGNPQTKRRTFFIKKHMPTLYVLGGEGVCDAFRLVMTRNNRLNEWKYVPELCLPEPLHTIACTYNLAEKTAKVWGVYADAKVPIPVEVGLELRANAEKRGDELVLPVPDFAVPADSRPVPLAAGVATLTNVIVCAGGFVSVADGTLTNEAWLYDMKAKRTLELPPLQVARSSLCVAIVDRSSAAQTQWMAFAIGGFNGTRKTAIVERYILGRDCWEITNPMSTPRSGFATAVVDRSIYAIGGRSGYAVVSSAETMHAQTNQWAPVGSMNLARAMHSAVFYDNHIIVVGGWTGQEWTGSVERYDLAHDKWVSIVALPVPMGHAMLAMGEIGREECVQDEAFG